MAAAAGTNDGATNIVIVDSVTKLGPDSHGTVAIAASHGGIYAGYLAAKAGARGVILHDAGVGLEQAGIAALGWLEALGIAAATVGHSSCRIGSGRSMAMDGVVSFVNATAGRLGCAAGQPTIECARYLLAAPLSTVDVPAIAEARFILREAPGKPRVIGCDSTSLVTAEDLDQVVVTGSHGEVLESAPTWGNRPDVAGAVFHDAGIDVTMNTASRLPDLDRRGVPAAVVAAHSARIGDARSIWLTGIVSQVNRTAAARGAAAGMRVPGFVDAVTAARKKRTAAGEGRRPAFTRRVNYCLSL